VAEKTRRPRSQLRSITIRVDFPGMITNGGIVPITIVIRINDRGVLIWGTSFMVARMVQRLVGGLERVQVGELLGLIIMVLLRNLLLLIPTQILIGMEIALPGDINRMRRHMICLRLAQDQRVLVPRVLVAV
jgi:hypothetical protein